MRRSECKQHSEAVGNSHLFAVDDVRSVHLTLTSLHSQPQSPISARGLPCPPASSSLLNHCHDHLLVQQSVATMSSVHEPTVEYAEPTE
jgi:hypothetical protein